MTELIIEVANESILTSLKKVLSNLDGVRVSKNTARRKTGIELAKEDVKAGRVTKWNSIDEMFDEKLNK